MKYLTEFRDPVVVKNLISKIKKITTQQWKIMEICGGQTHSIMKYSLQDLLPNKIELIHGPGCPVCVTPIEQIEKAIIIALREDVIFTSFGDMLRVPGSELDLLSVKAKGGDVRIVYSPLEAVKLAQSNPDKKVVFFAVGFETTAPANGMAVLESHKKGLNNFSILSSHVLVPPAIEALLSSAENKIQGFLAAGHVCTVKGFHEYIPISKKYGVPIVITGFEPVDILSGILQCVLQLELGKSEVSNQYSRVVSEMGNLPAQKVLTEVFEVIDRKWRGIGTIPKSGLGVSKKYESYDAEKVFNLGEINVDEPEICIVGEVLTGLKKPHECSAFGKECTPEHPLGAAMVSTEGACSAYYRYNKKR
ncbi:MAG: hydrogenase formation protein HypD [Bacteroidetes bacterium]|nr:hydrogenase formation protein HypD [Bacteroidota bacterium]